jgi:hypothetical protein
MGYLSSTKVHDDLAKFRSVDLAPRDPQAEAHAREHMVEGAFIPTSTNIDGNSDGDYMPSFHQLKSVDEGQARSIAGTDD